MDPTTNKTATTASDEDVGPSRVMEIGLHALVTGLLVVSIIGIAYVYGFNLNTGSLLDNISAAVRALGVDGGFFLGLYFSRRLWMRRKRGWGDGLKTSLFGLIWFLVALLMASLSWFSNTLFVTNYQTIITSDLLTRAGFANIPPELVNKAIGAIPLVIVLLYSIVPRRMQEHTDTRTPEDIEAEALREAARIRAQNMVAAARAEGAGQRVRTVLGGLAKEAFNLEERAQRDERLKQMRIALLSAGFESAGTWSDDNVELQAVSRGVWDPKKNEAIKPKTATNASKPTIETALPNLVEVAAAALDPNEAGPASAGNDLLSVADFASLIGVERTNIYYWIKPDCKHACKLLPEEMVIMPSGDLRIHSAAALRLLPIWRNLPKNSANGAGGGKTGTTTRRGNSSPRLPVVSTNGHQTGATTTLNGGGSGPAAPSNPAEPPV